MRRTKKKKEEGRMESDVCTKRKERRSRKTERTVSNSTGNTVMTSADCTENHRDCPLKYTESQRLRTKYTESQRLRTNGIWKSVAKSESKINAKNNWLTE